MFWSDELMVSGGQMCLWWLFNGNICQFERIIMTLKSLKTRKGSNKGGKERMGGRERRKKGGGRQAPFLPFPITSFKKSSWEIVSPLSENADEHKCFWKQGAQTHKGPVGTVFRWY